MKSAQTMTDVLLLNDAERSIVNWVLRQRRSTLAQLSAQFRQSPEALSALLDQLVAAGFLLETVGQYRVAVRTKPYRPSTEQLWDALTD